MSESPNGSFEGPWTKKKAKAVVLMAADELPDHEIAKQCNVSERSLNRWKQETEFKRRLEAYKTAATRRILEHGIAVKENRIKALNDRHQKMETVIRERAAAAEMEKVPGGKTGLVCVEVKSLGAGDNFKLVPVVQVDTALLKEMRETEKQVAIELAQWTEVQQLQGPNGAPLVSKIVVEYVDTANPVAEAARGAAEDTPGSETV